VQHFVSHNVSGPRLASISSIEILEGRFVRRRPRSALQGELPRRSVDTSGSSPTIRMLLLRAALRIEMKNRLYVGNLAFATTEDSLKNAFGEFGDVSEVKLIIDRETGRSRGFAFVVMSTGEQAQKAVERLDGALLDGRALRVNEAQERNGAGFAGGNDRGPRSSERRNRW
jgi:hypothetical protein